MSDIHSEAMLVVNDFNAVKGVLERLAKAERERGAARQALKELAETTTKLRERLAALEKVAEAEWAVIRSYDSRNQPKPEWTELYAALSALQAEAPAKTTLCANLSCRKPHAGDSILPGFCADCCATIAALQPPVTCPDCHGANFQELERTGCKTCGGTGQVDPEAFEQVEGGTK